MKISTSTTTTTTNAAPPASGKKGKVAALGPKKPSVVRSAVPPSTARQAALNDALQFVQARLGPILRPGSPSSPEQGAITLGATYPKNTKKGVVKPNRLGGNGPAAVLLDASDTVIVDAFSDAFGAELRQRGASVTTFHKDMSLGRATFEWAASDQRSYPFLAVNPSKASVANETSLALSYSPEFARVCAPGSIVEFNAPYVRRIRALLQAKEISATAWRAACARRASRVSINGPYTTREVNAHNKKLLADLALFGEELLNDLPTLDSGDYLALSALYINKEPLTW